MATVKCPLGCETNLTWHCDERPNGTRPCEWVRCKKCEVTIDVRRWRAFHAKSGSTVDLPARS